MEVYGQRGFIICDNRSDLRYRLRESDPETKEKLLQQAPCFERMFRILVQRNLARVQERLFRTIATTATEKYLDFIERYPDIPQRVAQHYIASYLGFSPEFLSKVRTKLSKK